MLSKMRDKSIPERTKSKTSLNVKVSQFTTPDPQVIMSRVHPQVMVVDRLAVICFTVASNRRKPLHRAVARTLTLIGGGGVYSYIQVLLN